MAPLRGEVIMYGTVSPVSRVTGARLSEPDMETVTDLSRKILITCTAPSPIPIGSASTANWTELKASTGCRAVRRKGNDFPL